MPGIRLTDAAALRDRPRVACSGKDFLVVWEDLRNGKDWDVHAARVSGDGRCSCPQMRVHLDWYKRSYVPEAYRYSIGILDTNGNLIMHLGRYANFDTAPGGKNGAKPGGTDIGMTCARYIAGTDDYLVFEDWGERIIVLKLDYHAEEAAPIR